MNTHAPNPQPRPSLWRRLGLAWAAFMGRAPRMPRQVLNAHAELVDTPHSPLAPQATDGNSDARSLQPYNTQALPAARELWLRGDWASLSGQTLDELQGHPDRAKLALLAAAGHMQLGRNQTGADYLRQAQAWGCSPQLMRQVVVAGVHNTLGKAAALADMPERADQHFAASLRTVMPMKSGIAEIQQRQSTQTQALQWP